MIHGIRRRQACGLRLAACGFSLLFHSVFEKKKKGLELETPFFLFRSTYFMYVVIFHYIQAHKFVVSDYK
jgi:hypothetical protein